LPVFTAAAVGALLALLAALVEGAVTVLVEPQALTRTAR